MKRIDATVLLSLFCFLLLCLFASPRALTAAVSQEAEVRGVVLRVFQQLKARDYGSLYDELPSSSRNRMSRERFTNALARAQGIYALDRMDVGAIRVGNDIAVVDTVLYGRLAKPFETEGKIVAQQYLIREDSRWRVATGDSATTRRFLANNPEFSRKFPIKQPRVYIKRNGDWVEFKPGNARSATTN